MSTHTARGPGRPWVRPAVVVLLSLLAVAAATAETSSTGFRVVALLSFLFFGPGLGLVGGLDIREPWRELSLVIGVSLAVGLVVVAAMAYAGNRTSGEALTVLLVIALAGAVAQLALRIRRRNAEVAS